LSKKILVLNDSPRLKGNTATLSDQLVAGARKASAIVEIVYLHGLDVQACAACGACQTGGKGCVIGDEMGDIYPKLRSADAIVIATPVYCYRMKLCLDRWYALESGQDFELKGKRLSLLMVYGNKDLYSSGGITVIHTLEGICRYAGMDLDDIVLGSAMAIGDAEKDPSLMDQPCRLGKSLAQPA